jgi:hypothetical protein
MPIVAEATVPVLLPLAPLEGLENSIELPLDLAEPAVQVAE